MKKSELEQKLQKLRRKYKKAQKENRVADMTQIAKEGRELRELIDNTKWCYVCKQKEVNHKGSYCSQLCQDKYWEPKKVQPTIEDIKRRINEIKKQKHVDKLTDINGQIRMG